MMPSGKRPRGRVASPAPGTSPPAPGPTPSPQPVAYSYIRFSTPEQAEGDSLRRQESLRDAWLAKRGVRLDTSLSLRDEGVTAFTGEHRDNPDRHALAAFLELIKLRKVPKGSFLIIENLDRLTREDAVPALHLFTGILSGGVKIVQLHPEAEYTARSDYFEIMRAIIELSRGNSESRAKSVRLSEAWAAKRRRAAEKKAVMTSSCPAWITVAKGRYTLNKRRAAVVRRIFRLAMDGHGVRSITKALCRDVEPISGRAAWNTSYVRLILTNPAAYGQFQPKSKGKPDGPPIPGYYPPVVSEDVFHAVQGAMSTRRMTDENGKPRGKGGRVSKAGVNVFAGLLRDGLTGSPIHMHTYRRANGHEYPNLVNYRGNNTGEVRSFPMIAFERAIFKHIGRIDPRAILPGHDETGDRTLTLTGRAGVIDRQLAGIRARIKAGDELDTLTESARDLEREKREIEDELNVIRQKAARPAAESWGECKTLLDALDRAPDKHAARVKLRSTLRRIVKEVWCLFAPGRGTRWAFAQIVFKEGDWCSEFLMEYKPPVGNAKTEAFRRARVRVMPMSVRVTPFPGEKEIDPRSNPMIMSDPRAARCYEWLWNTFITNGARFPAGSQEEWEAVLRREYPELDEAME